ncbi:hypothetical protein N0V82_007390 [Gnomoniopsis sp. IMI 355080]|nr:hypothetical protein N0V82_007390 [Gnomoniopsis sp. IMI 355080]
MMDTIHITSHLILLVLAILFLLLVTKSSGAIPPLSPISEPQHDAKKAERVDRYKDMYHKLQNLEDFPEILPIAKQLLTTLLELSLLLTRYKARPRNILDVKLYDPVAPDRFLAAERQDILDEFESYIKLRKAGSAPVLFQSREGAIQRLKRNGRDRDRMADFLGGAGDGDLEKNHISIYRDLLRSVGVNLPDGDSIDFIHPRTGINQEQVWRSATGHLLVYLFPNDFLSEILGFNLHFESLSTADLKSGRELPEFGISSRYYNLHVSIDNADSGHSAMALATIIRLMDLVRVTGIMDYESTWRRIQVGYLLSQTLNEDETVEFHEEKLAEMLYRKAQISGKIHLRELSWNGKMFGSFTRSEAGLLRTGSTRSVRKMPANLVSHVFAPHAPIVVSKVRTGALLRLWFTHPYLLENSISSPYRTATILAYKTLKLLRAELGFMEASEGIAGMDEQLLEHYRPDLVALGLEMVHRQGLPEPTSLWDVLHTKGPPEDLNMDSASKYAYNMLSWSMRPKRNGVSLLGLARAFLDLEAWVADHDSLLSTKARAALRLIVEKKAAVLEGVGDDLAKDESQHGDFISGYELGRKEIQRTIESAPG